MGMSAAGTARRFAALLPARRRGQRISNHFAALRSVANGTSRQFTATQHFGRFRAKRTFLSRAYGKRIMSTPEQTARAYFRQPAIGHSSLAVARFSGHTDLYALP